MTLSMLAAGFAAGVLSSMGLGGGTVLLLYLRMLTDTKQLKAQSMNLLFFVPAAVLSVILYAKKGMIRWRMVLPFCALGAAGALLGVWLAGVLDAALIGKLFALLLIVMGVTGFFSTGAAHKNKGRPCLI